MQEETSPEQSPIKVGALYKHFKGKTYKIIAIARDCDTLEELVIYEGQYDSEEFGPKPVWVRKKRDFLSKKVFADGKKIGRFTLLFVSSKG